jgi:long-chain acyl-CoA synthetase
MKNIPLYEVAKIKDLRDMLHQSVATYGNKAAFLIKDAKAARVADTAGLSQAYRPVTFRQYSEDVDALGTWFMKQDLAGGRIAILAETRYEWYVTYLATVNGVGVVVPLDKELPAVEIANLLNRSHTTVLVYSRAKQKEVDAIRATIPTVRYFVCMDEPANATDLYFWNWLEQGQAELKAGNRSFLDAPIDPEVLQILLFTSGTTAQSKAVMLSHRNICINLQAMCQMYYISPNDIFLSVLPIHHTYECTCGFLCPIYRGSTVAVCEGLRHITRNMQECKCTIMLAVPLMIEMFYKRIMKAATADPKLARKFKLGLKISKLLRMIGIDRRRKLFAKVHETFGGELKAFIAGGAAIDPAILKGMRDLGLDCVQGYGLTECAPILALNRDVDYKNEAAGLPLPGVEVKIIDADENGIGEIIGKGPNVMLGYFENEAATAEAIDKDGFFHTGDLGFLDKDGFVIITGRKKNVIIAKNGKNIFPEEIEFKLLQHDLIAECLISGVVDDDGETLVVAEIFPNEEKVKELLGDIELTSEAVRQKVNEIIREVNHSLVTYKYIKKFNLRATEFEKTTSRKIKRKY